MKTKIILLMILMMSTLTYSQTLVHGTKVQINTMNASNPTDKVVARDANNVLTDTGILVSALGSSSEFTDDVFFIKDNLDTTKKISFEASGISTATTRTITMPNMAVNLGDIITNNAKVTNATHTGDVTGSTLLTIANGSVDLPMLSATGTASNTTYLRGDNTWAMVSGKFVDGTDPLDAVYTTGNVGIGTTIANQKLTVEGTIDLKEQATANTDVASYGQLWVKNTTPNQLWFTDDSGVDTQLGVGGGGSSPLTTKGDIYTYDTADQRLPLGTQGQILLVDTAQSTGLRWGNQPLTADYGGAGFENNATATVIAVANTYYKVLGTTTNTALIDFTHSSNRLTYVGAETRNFELTVSSSIVISGLNVNLSIKFAKNGTVIGYPATITAAKSTDTKTLSLIYNVSLATNDYIEIFIANETDTTNITIEDLFFSIKSL